MAVNINVCALTGNLTRDPELRSTNSGFSICSLRIAVNGRRKDQQTGTWVDDANYFDVTVFGAQGENCAKYLAKGRPVAIQGRLDWREWQAQDGSKRQAVQVIAESVQFLSSGEQNGGGGNYGGGQQQMTPDPAADFQPQGGSSYGSLGGQPPAQQAPAQQQPAQQGGGGGTPPPEDDIPFAFDTVPAWETIKGHPYSQHGE